MKSVYSSLKNLYSTTAIDSAVLSNHKNVQFNINFGEQKSKTLINKININKNMKIRQPIAKIGNSSDSSVIENKSLNEIQIYKKKFNRNSPEMLKYQIENTLTIAEKKGLVQLNGKLTELPTNIEWQNAENKFLKTTGGSDFICVMCFGYLGNCSNKGETIITSCGHAMHMYCFDAFNKAINRPKKSQYVCPLCRSFCVASISLKIHKIAQEYVVTIIQNYARGFFARRKVNARRYFKSEVFHDSLKINTKMVEENLKEENDYIQQELQHVEEDLADTNTLVEQYLEMRKVNWDNVISNGYSRCSVCPICYAQLKVISKIQILPLENQKYAEFKILSCCSAIVHTKCLKMAEKDWFHQSSVKDLKIDDHVIKCSICKKCYSDIGISGIETIVDN